VSRVINSDFFNTKDSLEKRLSSFSEENERLTRRVINNFRIYPYFLLLVAKNTHNSLFEAQGVVNAVFREIEDISRANGKELSRKDKELCEDLRHLIVSNIGNLNALREIFPFLEYQLSTETETETEDMPTVIEEPVEVVQKSDLYLWCENARHRPSLQLSLILALANSNNFNRVVTFEEISTILWKNLSVNETKGWIPVVVLRANEILKSASADLGVSYAIVSKRSQGYMLVVNGEQ
jgi:hypothetical protein